MVSHHTMHGDQRKHVAANGMPWKDTMNKRNSGLNIHSRETLMRRLLWHEVAILKSLMFIIAHTRFCAWIQYLVSANMLDLPTDKRSVDGTRQWNTRAWIQVVHLVHNACSAKIGCASALEDALQYVNDKVSNQPVHRTALCCMACYFAGLMSATCQWCFHHCVR